MLASECDLCAHVRTTTVVRKRKSARAQLFVTLRCTSDLRASRIGTDMIPLAGRRVPCASARYCFRTERTRNCSLIESYPAYASAAPLRSSRHATAGPHTVARETDHDKARGLHVKPVDQAVVPTFPERLESVAISCEEPIQQRVRVVADSWLSDDARGLVDDQEVVVGELNVELDGAVWLHAELWHASEVYRPPTVYPAYTQPTPEMDLYRVNGHLK